ncbi:hypothetical protein JQX13_34155 [Archangium violaceum]|uniref:hypothetical protein n=1 Tax=Archangium violaceum TaxID=83451 RepID=UPI00193C0168|nr:hypothetical protein [Archangium violaceum]QRK05216.1 hypothetical protein JQX13_34155 [Archangium violaceum]
MARRASPNFRDAKRRDELRDRIRNAALEVGRGPGHDELLIDNEHPDDVIPTVAMLCTRLHEAALDAQKLEHLARSSGAATAPSQVIPLLGQLETAISELKGWARDYSHQKLARRDADAVRKYDDRRAFCVRLMTWSARLGLPLPRAAEMMVLSVLVELEPPGEDYEKRLDTWRKRYRKAEHDLPTYEFKTSGRPVS